MKSSEQNERRRRKVNFYIIRKHGREIDLPALMNTTHGTMGFTMNEKI